MQDIFISLPSCIFDQYLDSCIKLVINATEKYVKNIIFRSFFLSCKKCTLIFHIFSSKKKNIFYANKIFFTNEK